MDVIVLGTTAVALLAALVVGVVLLVRWRRRRYRFSLRALLLTFLVVGCGLFAVQRFLLPVLQHRWAIWQIHSAGGSITPEDFEDAHLRPPNHWQSQNIWSGVSDVAADGDREAIAVAQHLASVPELQCANLHYVTDAGLEAICRAAPHTSISNIGLYRSHISGNGVSDMSGLKNLRQLFLNTCQLDDAALDRFRSIPDLRYLYLLEWGKPPNPTRFTETSFAEIGRLKNLELLSLGGLEVPDAAARHLHNLKRLKTLRLTYCQVSDQALEELREALPDCQLTRDLNGTCFSETSDFEGVHNLYLHANEVDHTVLARLAPMPDLRYVGISAKRPKSAPPAQIGDECFGMIGTVENLEFLDLSGLEISDAAARSLHGLKRLKELKLNQCRISPSAVEGLRQALPDCDVECWKNVEP